MYIIIIYKRADDLSAATGISGRRWLLARRMVRRISDSHVHYMYILPTFNRVHIYTVYTEMRVYILLYIRTAYYF